MAETNLPGLTQDTRPGMGGFSAPVASTDLNASGGLKNPGVQAPAPAAQTSSPTGMDDNSYMGFMNSLNTNLQQNNELVNQKNLIQKQLFDQPLSQDELKKLPPDMRNVVSAGNPDAMKLQLKIINDTLQGRNDSVAKSIGFLTTSYQQHQSDIKSAISSLETYATNNGLKLGDLVGAMAPLIGKDMAEQLKTNLNSIQYGANRYGLNPEGGVGGFGGPASSIASSLGTTPTTSLSEVLSTVGIDSLVDKIIGNENSSLSANLNNPGDIKFAGLPGQKDSGVKASDGGTFAAYDTPAEGRNAIAQLIQNAANGTSSAYGANPTLGSFIDKYTNTGRSIDQAFATSAAYPSDENKNTIDPVLGVTPLALYNDARDFMFGIKAIQAVTGGLSSSGAVQNYKNTVKNKAGAMLDELGITQDQATALYKANSSAATQNVQRLARVDSISNSIVNQFPRLETLADKVKAAGIDVTEQDIQAGAAKALAKFGSQDAANYIELLNTIRADYAAQNAALAGSRGGEFFAKSAMEAIPLGYTGDQYKGLADTILKSATNVKDGINKTIQELIGTSGGTSKPSSSSPTNQDFPSLIKTGIGADQYETLKKNNPGASDEELYNELKKNNLI